MPTGTFDPVIQAVMALLSRGGQGLPSPQRGVNDSRYIRDDAEQVNTPQTMNDSDPIGRMMTGMGQQYADTPYRAPVPGPRPGQMPVPMARPPQGGETTPYTGPPEVQGGGPQMPGSLEELLADPRWRAIMQNMK